MSIETAFERVSDKIDQAYDAVEEKGGVVPSSKKLANLPTAIKTIPTGTGGAAKLQQKTVTPTKSEQVVTADSSYDALSKVTVKAIPDEFGGGNLQSKTVSPSGTRQTVTPDSGYDGLSQVVVNPAILQSKSVTPSTTVQNVAPDSGNYGLSQVSVGKIPDVYKDTSDATASPGDILSGKTAYVNGEKVTGTASGTATAPKLQSKMVIPTAFAQTVKPDASYNGLSQVTVTAIPEEPVNTEYRWWSPNMSSNTMPAPYKLFGDSLNSTSYKILDNSGSTIESLAPPTSASTSIPELGFDFGIPVKISGVKVTALTASNVSNNIKTIRISGNNNGENNDFTLIKEQDVSSVMTNTKEVTITFNPAAYRYFKFQFTERETLSERKVYVGDITFYREFVIANVNLQAKTVNPSTSQQVVKADTNYDGLSQVTVNAAALQPKTATPSASQQVISPDSGKIGLSTVTVAATPLEERTVTPSTTAQSITPSSGKVGMSKVTVNGVALEEKTVSPATSVQTVTPTAGKTGLSKVTINAVALETKSVTPSASAQTVTPTSGKMGLSSVSVAAIPAAYKNTSDATATAAEIRSGKTAYNSTGKITGTMGNATISEGNYTSIDGSTGQISVSLTSSGGYVPAGPLTSVKISQSTYAGGTFTPKATAQTVPTAQNYCTGNVVINGDANLAAGNIRSGVSIFGVNGSYAGTTLNNQAKSAGIMLNGGTVYPDAGYTGLSSVAITPYRWGKVSYKFTFVDQATCDMLNQSTMIHAAEIDDYGAITWRNYYINASSNHTLSPGDVVKFSVYPFQPIWIGPIPYTGLTRDPWGKTNNYKIRLTMARFEDDFYVRILQRNGAITSMRCINGEFSQTMNPEDASKRDITLPCMIYAWPYQDVRRFDHTYVELEFSSEGYTLTE